MQENLVRYILSVGAIKLMTEKHLNHEKIELCY